MGCSSDKGSWEVQRWMRLWLREAASPASSRNTPRSLPSRTSQSGTVVFQGGGGKNALCWGKDLSQAASITYRVPKLWQTHPSPRCPPSLLCATVPQPLFLQASGPPMLPQTLAPSPAKYLQATKPVSSGTSGPHGGAHKPHFNIRFCSWTVETVTQRVPATQQHG